VNTATPVLSVAEPEIKVSMSVSQGTWTNSPLAYSYQWEDCNASGGECVPIGGATNASYVPSKQDTGHALVAQVTASNSTGAVSVSTVASAVVRTLDYEREIGTTGEGEGQLKNPEGVGTDSKNNIWVADTGNNRIEEFSPTGTYLGRFGSLGTGNGELAKPHGLVIDKKGDFYVVDTGNNRVEEFNEEEKYVRQFNTGLNKPAGIALDATGNVWVTNPSGGTLNMIVEFSAEGERLREWGYSGELLTGWFKNPQGITIGATGTIWIADTGNNKLQSCDQNGNCQYSGSLGSGNDQFLAPAGITTDGSGNLWVADTGNNRIQELTSTGSYDQQLGSKGTGNKQLEGPVALGLDVSGDLYVADTKNNRITKWAVPSSTEPGPPEPPNPGTSSVSTIEYGVPLSGTGVGLQNMTAGEVSKWGQKDDPVEATAIFPPDKVMGWPAQNYKRATVMYFDSQARTVNVAAPSGAVSTTEYNENNDVERTLSAANRATALKEVNPAESAKLLDTENKYTTEGTELVETTGPQHTIKLSGGSEVQARDHVKYSYDEGAPEGEEHGLVTRAIDSALVGGKEEEPRTTRTYYSGQNGLGWKLREPTSVVTDPTGLDLTHTTVYNETTGSVVETRASGGTSETVYPPVYTGSVGSEGVGTGQFKGPQQVALDASGNLWVDDKGNSRIEKFSSSGTYLAAYGTHGSGNGQFSNPSGLAINQTTGNVYVSDSANSRVEELNNSGEFVRAFGTIGSGEGQFKEPAGLTIDAKGDVWVSDSGNSRVEEFNETGGYLSQFGGWGSGNGQLKEPFDIAISEGDLYVSDNGNSRIEEFSPSGAYLAQFGSKGKGSGQFEGPTGIAVNPISGDLFVSDYWDYRIEEFTPAGKYLTTFGYWGTSGETFRGPSGITISATGKVYITDTENAKVTEWQPPGTGGMNLVYSTQFGSEGSGNGQFHQPVSPAIDGHNNVWVSDFYKNRIQEFSAAGQFIATYGSYGSGNGQFIEPTGVDVNQSTGNVYIADSGNNRIEELSSTGTFIRAFASTGTEPGHLKDPGGLKIDSAGNVWVADTANNRIQEFSSTGGFIAAYGSAGSGNGQFKEPRALAFSAGYLYVADSENNRIQELSSTGSYLGQFGSEGSGSGEFYQPDAIAADPAGNLYISDRWKHKIQEFSATGVFLATFGSNGSGEGQFHEPMGVTINPAGVMYVADGLNNRMDVWTPADQAVHDTKTIYYTAKGEAEVAACQNHPEWVNLVCETLPVAQPEPSELPKLPVTTIKYNVWNEPEAVIETFGTTTRTKTTSFDPAGRPITSEITSTIGTPVSAVTDKYDGKTGALAEESNTVAGKTKTITSLVNSLGQLEQYTDAEGNITTYKHDVDGRVTETADVIETGGTKEPTYQKYTYDETTGFMNKLEDSAAKTFTVSRDVVGRITSETYPNAMNATTTYNAVGQATSIHYEKTAHCAGTCPETWFNETVTPSIHGETLARTNTLTTDAYTYDTAGRLVQTQETPAGKGCVTRLYAYDEESNRTSLTSRPAGTEGKCATEGGTTETHRYDPANRLNDTGVSYETFGNTTKLPGADAGGPEMEIKTEYYVDNQVANQTQNGETYKYTMDPAGRVRETESSGKTSALVITHYSGPGSALAWTSEEEGKRWTRNIPGIDGTLAAIQPSIGTITLQLHDLQGNVVDTAADNETETKLLTSYNSTEFGTPLNGAPPKYAWLGAVGVSSEQSSGLVTQDGVTYVPQTGRPLQTQGVTPPTPDNKATAYVSTIEAGIDASAAAASAQQVANAEQAKKALEGASGQPGLVTSEEFGSECSGSNACSSSRISCKITLMFGEQAANELFAGSIFACSGRVLDFELQVVILVESDPECGASCGFKNLEYNHTPDGHVGQIFENTSSGRAYARVEYCAEGIGYRAWTWGRVFGSHNFVSKGLESGVLKCEGKGSHDFYSELIDAGFEH
jgi:YD repeat-containing protein